MFLPRKPSVRRFALLGLALLALVLVATVAAVMLSDDPLLAEGEVFPEEVVINTERRPDIVFPESVRTTDLSLNRFVDRFARVCMQGRYSDLRLMLSSRSGDPIVARRFESMFNALKQVRIIALQKLPNVRGLDDPVYLMKAEYLLENYAAAKERATEHVRLAIAKEDGNWRIGPIPRDLLARLENSTTGSAASADESAGELSRSLAESGPSLGDQTRLSDPAEPVSGGREQPRSRGGSKPTTNRPAKLGS
jgi:hypothetical protein